MCQRSSSAARRAPELHPHPHPHKQLWGVRAPARCFCTFQNPVSPPWGPNCAPSRCDEFGKQRLDRCHKDFLGASHPVGRAGGRRTSLAGHRGGKDVSPAHRNVSGVKKLPIVSKLIPASNHFPPTEEHEPQAGMQWPRVNPENLAPNKQLGKAFGMTKLWAIWWLMEPSDPPHLKLLQGSAGRCRNPLHTEKNSDRKSLPELGLLCGI